MTTQQPVSLVEATGTGDASGWKEDWHQRDLIYPYSTPQMPMWM